MAYSMTKHEFMNIMIQRKIRERFKPFKGGLKVNQYQDVVGECWESKFNYKPNWNDCSSECKIEKNRLQQNYNRVLAKYISNRASRRPFLFGISNDVLISMCRVWARPSKRWVRAAGRSRSSVDNHTWHSVLSSTHFSKNLQWLSVKN